MGLRMNEEYRKFAKEKMLGILADYLLANIAHKSILNEMGKPEGKFWADMCNLIGVRAYDDNKQMVINRITKLMGSP